MARRPVRGRKAMGGVKGAEGETGEKTCASEKADEGGDGREDLREREGR
jgi:hypothetical protein